MSQTKQIRTLLVDDYDVLRDGLALCFEDLDDMQLVGKASSGLEAVRLCELLKPDVVLMDIMMPQMDGITATKAIHQYDPTLPIIALTSFLDEKLIQSARQAGMCDYLLKNISLDELVTAIRRAYTQSR